MSRKAVRHTLAGWFGDGNVAGLNHVGRFMTARGFTVAEALGDDGPAPSGTGAAGWVHLPRVQEQRLAMAGPDAKVVGYSVILETKFIARPAPGEQLDVDAVADAYDDFVEAVMVRMREDPTAGGALLQMGECEELDEDEITIEGDVPLMQANSVEIVTKFKFMAVEVVEG